MRCEGPWTKACEDLWPDEGDKLCVAWGCCEGWKEGPQKRDSGWEALYVLSECACPVLTGAQGNKREEGVKGWLHGGRVTEGN